jgi:hypothetical protein
MSAAAQESILSRDRERERFRFCDGFFGPLRFDGLSSSQTDQSIEEVRARIAPTEAVAFVDPENRWTDAELSVYRRFFFVERVGVDWGAPADDEAALQELKRLQGQGVRYLVFLWAFWWLETYPRLFEELQSHSRRPLRNRCLIVFQVEPE